MDLIKLIIPWKDWEQTEHLKEHAPYSPVIHFMIIVTVSEETFRRTIPSSGNVLSERRLRVDSSAGAKVC
jgi:hypothetical protein